MRKFDFLIKIFVVLLFSLCVSSCSENGFTGRSGIVSSSSSSSETEIGDPYDPDGNGEISDKEYNAGLFGPIQAQLHRGEGDCLTCKATVTLKLVRIGGKKLSASIQEKATVSIFFQGSGKKAEIQGDNLICPTKSVVADFEMSISYAGKTVDSSDRGILLGARDPENNNKIYIGLADRKESNYAFHNVDTLIASVSCPDAQRIAIKDLCRDKVLEKEKSLLRCWMITGPDDTCPSGNSFSTDHDYPAECKEDTW